MSRTWIAECVRGTGLCRDQTVKVCGQASNSDNGSQAWETEDHDSDCKVEANATACQGSTQVGRKSEHTDGSFVPARLLDLFPVSAHAPGCISLVESIRLKKGVRYAALSYCWGDVKPTVLTTRANLDSQKQGIKLSALPQCLRDAVTVAHSLEIRYLWIDALCIIQDDNDDWARESATMWQLFHNAYITIAAASSESFDEGFLTRRPFQGFDVDFSSVLNPQAVGKITLSTIPTQRRYSADQELEVELRHSKWDTRGWVWQEQKLSKRLLVFGKRMIHFKCEHCVRSEDESNERDVTPPSQDDRTWWTMRLQNYTPKSFAFPQDKLPGISGLSKQINQNSIHSGAGPAEYLAGIWYCSDRCPPPDPSSWQHQLCWKASTPCLSFNQILEQCRRAEPQTYIAPSWSWASCSGGVEWLRYDDLVAIDGWPSLFEAEIEDHHMNLTGPDPTGRVGPGSYLKLSGFMHRDPLDLSGLEPLQQDYGDRSFHWLKRNTVQAGCVALNLDWEHTDHEHHSSECELRLFGLWRLQTTWDRDISNNTGTSCYESIEFYGLILFRDKVSGSYFRVGIFRRSTYRQWSALSSYEKQNQWFHDEGWDRQSVHII